MLQLIFALAVIQAHAPETRTLGAEWSHVQRRDWTELNVSQGILALYRLDPAPDQVWVRLERLSADDGILSERALFEVDCQDREIRILDVMISDQQNLIGEYQAAEGTPSPWWPVEPDTNFEQVYGLVC